MKSHDKTLKNEENAIFQKCIFRIFAFLAISLATCNWPSGMQNTHACLCVLTNVMEEMIVFPAGGGKFSDISSSFEPESSQERPSGLCYNEFLLSRFAAIILLKTKKL